jgi:hypothetical protein
LSPPPSDDENNNDDINDEAELLESIAEKEAEMRRTQELVDERMRQVEATLAQLHRVNNLLEQFQTLSHDNVNTNN